MKLPPFLLLVDFIFTLVSQIQTITIRFSRIATRVVMSIVSIDVRENVGASRQTNDEHHAYHGLFNHSVAPPLFQALVVARRWCRH